MEYEASAHDDLERWLHHISASAHDDLERLLHDESAEPRELPQLLLHVITNHFAYARRISTDGPSALYKGVLRSGEVAVKKPYESAYSITERLYETELGCVMRVKHKNIVRFLGYCAYTELDTEFQWVQLRHKLLCFEYPTGGTLQGYISDASRGLIWRERYKLIKGICEGLFYLHRELTVHLDLKPTNIWLDEEKVPKIYGFYKSRCLEEKQSKIIIENPTGARGYKAPEFLKNGVVTFKTDIFSLGVLIMEILTGQKECCVAENVLKCWADRLGTSLEDTCLEQVRVCAEIGRSCLEADPKKRPDAGQIIDMLLVTESTDDFDFNEPDEMENVDEFTPDEQTMELNILERVVAGSEESSYLDLSLLQSITENFSEQRKIGVGGCGAVYKGILRNGIVAVKRLFSNRTIKDKMFHREVQSLITVRHENIVQFLGYSSFTEERVLIFDGRTIMADIRERLLCFEYISNGSLENHLADELRGLEWHTRYEIIVGICKGLFYLHKEKNIIHMDLKPANILLDDLMVPKITDFGLSRLDNNSQAATTSRLMTPGYCAPEYIDDGIATNKSDIYSLGVMVIELVTGSKKEHDLTKVLRRWRHRWIKSSKHSPLGYQQVTRCLKLAQRCIQKTLTARPDIVCILNELNTTDSTGGQFQEIPCLDDMLGIEPLEIRFPFELGPQISHPIELTNDTDGYIAFMTKASSRRFRIEPDKGIVLPRSKCSVTVTMQAQVNALPNNRYKEEITVLSTTVDGGLAAMVITGDVFTEKEGTVVDEVNVMVVFDKPPLAEES